MKQIAFLFTLVTLVLLCPDSYGRGGRVDLIGYLNQEFKNQRYKRLLISAPVGDFYFRDQLERRAGAYIRKMTNKGVQVKYFSKLFPPIRSYTEEDVKERINAMGADALLLIDVRDSTTKTWTTFSFSLYQGYGGGGTSIHSRRYTFADIVVFDYATKEIAWRGQGNITVRAGNRKSLAYTAKYLGKMLAKHLYKHGLIYVRPKPPRKQYRPLSDEMSTEDADF